MSNNLARPVLAPNQTQKEQTINDSVGAVDGAITGIHSAMYGDEDTIPSMQFMRHLVFVLEANSALSGDWTLFTPSDFPRGLIVVRNDTVGTATVAIAAHPDFSGDVLPGETALLVHTGVAVYRLT